MLETPRYSVTFFFKIILRIFRLNSNLSPILKFIKLKMDILESYFIIHLNLPNAYIYIYYICKYIYLYYIHIIVIMFNGHSIFLQINNLLFIFRCNLCFAHPIEISVIQWLVTIYCELINV